MFTKETRLDWSSNINEVIRPVLNLFFFTIRFHKYKKAPKSTKKHQKALKSIKKLIYKIHQHKIYQFKIHQHKFYQNLKTSK